MKYFILIFIVYSKLFSYETGEWETKGTVDRLIRYTHSEDRKIMVEIKLIDEKMKKDRGTTHYIIIGTPAVDIEGNSEVTFIFENERIVGVYCKSLLDQQIYELSDMNSDGKFDFVTFLDMSNNRMLEAFFITNGRLEPVDRALIDGRNAGDEEAMKSLKELQITQN
jgi:hypothetical protein